jgi:hypothetical protein
MRMSPERLPLPSIAVAALAAILLPPVGLTLGLLWSATGGERSEPAPILILFSLVGSIALLALIGGGS